MKAIQYKGFKNLVLFCMLTVKQVIDTYILWEIFLSLMWKWHEHNQEMVIIYKTLSSYVRAEGLLENL